MAFCNSCGAVLNPGAQACSKCGAAVPGTAAAPAPPKPAAVPPPPPARSSALRIVLAVIAAFVVLGVLGLSVVVFVGYRIAKKSHVTQDGQHVNIETPFGTVSANDPDQAVRELGVDVYPGAQVQTNGSAAVAFGGVHTVAATFESADSADKVCAFYKSKYPSATVTSSNRSRCTIVSNAPPDVITINVQDEGRAGSKFQITSVSKKPSSTSNPNSNSNSDSK